MFAALLMDIKNSREYAVEFRTEVQQMIRENITILNQIFASELERDVIFSGGDEIQGLFRTAQSAYLYQRLLRMLLFPVSLCSGIGYGGWTVRISGGVSTEQDGPAYHRARYALNTISKLQECKVLYNSESKEDIFINQMIHGTELLGLQCTFYQRQLTLFCELLYPIDAGQIMDCSSFPELFKIWNDRQVDKIDNLWEENAHDNCVDAFSAEAELCITAGQIRGISIELSKRLGISRQSVEKAIKAGYIIEMRNETIGILKYFKELNPVK